VIKLNHNKCFSVNPGVACILLASSDLMIQLAPYMMIAITLWGLCRLFRPRESEEEPDTQDDQDWDERYEYQDVESDDDNYDDEEEEE